MSPDEQSVRHDNQKLLLAVAVAVLTLLAYCPSYGLPFINYDDPLYGPQNRHVRAGLTVDGVRWAFTTFTAANWHPLTWLSLQLDAQLYGPKNPSGFHFTNVLLHVASSVLLFLVLTRLTGMPWPSVMVAGLFALHPLHVESVSWVSERKDVLSALFWMLALLAYADYVQRRSLGRYLLVALALLLGLLAKPMVVTLPCVLLLLDCWPLRRWRRAPGATLSAQSFARLFREKLPLFGLVLGFCIITFLVQRHSRAVQSLQTLSVGDRVANALLAYTAYLGKIFWPMHLAAYYPHPGGMVSWRAALWAGTLLLALTALLIGLGRRRPYLAVGWFWFLGTLVPVIGFVQAGTQGMADRYSYLPSIGVFLMLCWGAADLVRAWNIPRAAWITLAAGVLGCCVTITWIQQGYWGSDRALWTHAAAITEPNEQTLTNLAILNARADRPEQSLTRYAQALALNPEYVPAHYNRGLFLVQIGRRTEAMTEFQKTIELDPTHAPAHGQLGGCYYQAGQLTAARHEFEQAVTLDPDADQAHTDLALVLRDLGQFGQAQRHYRAALVLNPDSAPTHLGLALLLRELGQHEAAVAELARAIALDPRLLQARLVLGKSLVDQGRYGDAEAYLTPALQKLSPTDPARGLVLEQLARGRHLRVLETKLPSVLAGKEQPNDTEQRLEYAWLCQQPRHRHYVAAARFYQVAFAESHIDARWLQQYRYPAACAAVLAGSALDDSAGTLDDTAGERWRGLGLQWLRTELEAVRQQATDGSARQRIDARSRLHLWQNDLALASVRATDALQRLPARERSSWQRFWQDVEAAAREPQGDR